MIGIPRGDFCGTQSKCGWHLFFVTLGLLFWSSTEWICPCQHKEFHTLVLSKFYIPFSWGNAEHSGGFVALGIPRRNSMGEPWNPDPTPTTLQTNALPPFTSLLYFYFFFSPSCGWETHETLNSHGEIIGMKLEKLNFDEAISGSFLIALRAVKRRWRRSCRLSIPSPAPAPQTFCPPIGHSQSCFEFFQKVSCDHGFSRRLNIN